MCRDCRFSRCPACAPSASASEAPPERWSCATHTVRPCPGLIFRRASAGPWFDSRSYYSRVHGILRLLPVVGCLLALTGSAAASNPWSLHCASIPAEQPAPKPLAAEARRFFPWVATPSAGALHDGPMYLVALSSRTRISRDGAHPASPNSYSHPALIAA